MAPVHQYLFSAVARYVWLRQVEQRLEAPDTLAPAALDGLTLEDAGILLNCAAAILDRHSVARGTDADAA